MPDRLGQTRSNAVRGKTEELFHPGDVLIEQVILRSGLREVDVQRIMVSFNIFEDIYSNVLSGSLTLIDSINLIGTFPIAGLETVEIVFKTPGFPGAPATELNMRVYQISDRNTGSAGVLTDTTQSYTLQLVSHAYFRNQERRVRKAYSQMPISEMVERITGNILGEEVFVEATTGIQSFVIPSWKPFKAINWLASRARPEENPAAANYLFFETADGFQFRSLNDLSQRTPAMRLVYDPANFRSHRSGSGSGRSRSILPEMQLIRSYTILQSGSTMDRVNQGMYASKLITHDIVTKTFKTDVFDYLSNFAKLHHIEDQLVDSEGNVTTQKAKAFPGHAEHGSNPDALVRFYPKHNQMFDGIQDYDESQKWLLQRNSQLRQFESLRIQVEAPGINWLRAGQIVVLDVPRPENVKGSIHPDDRDPEVSGNYIVSNIHHIVSPDSHEMILELSKGSLPFGSNQGISDILDVSATSKIINQVPTGTEILQDLPFGLGGTLAT